MTNIEFLVNELRKANETIAQLRKENAKIKAEKKRVMEHNTQLGRRINELTHPKVTNINMDDLDVLAALKRQMEKS